MRREDHGAAGADEVVEQIFHLARRGGVEAGERFVEQHDGGRVDERGSERHFLFHAAGKRLDVVVTLFPETEGAEQFGGARLTGGGGQIPESGDEFEVFKRTEFAVEHRIVGHVGERALGVGGLGPERDAVDEHVACVGFQQAGDHSQAGGFAGAIGAEESVEHAGRHAEIEAVHGAHHAEVFAQRAGFARGRWSGGDREQGRGVHVGRARRNAEARQLLCRWPARDAALGDAR